MRWLKNIALILVILAGLVGLVASLGQYYYQNEVKQYVKTSLNEILAAPIDVNEINFSLIQKFPNASISFEEVLAWDAFPGEQGEDTLFYAGRIFLEFNIIDIIQKKYVLREIEIKDADIRLKWNKKGEPNYVIWKEIEGEKNPFKMDLEKVVFKDCHLLIDHMKSAFISSYSVREMALNGSINDQILDLKCEASLSKFSHMTDDFSYASEKELSINTDFYLDIDQKQISLNNASINWNDLKSEATGDIDYGLDKYQFNFTSGDQSLKDIMSVLPTNFTDGLQDYSLDSRVNFKLETGNRDQEDWKSIIDFEASDGKITHIPSAVSAKNLSYRGSISNYKSATSIQIDAFSGIFSGGKFEGRFSMINLEHPKISAELKGVFELAELIPFTKNDAITNAIGVLNVNLQFNGSFYDLKNIQKKEIERAITTGTIDLENIGFNLDRLNLQLRELNGRFNLNDNDAEIPHLTGVWKGSNMDLSGEIKNFMPFILLDDQRLNISAKGSFDRIALEELLSNGEADGQQESFEIPAYLRMEIDARIAEITYKKFIASDVLGHFIIQNSKLVSDNFEFSTADGKVKSYLFLSSKNGGLDLDVQGHLSQMAINKLFYEFDNMGQNIITDQNINGVLNADVSFQGFWDKNLQLDLSSIHVLANVKVDHGELIDLKSLEQIGEYLKSNPIASAFVDTKGLSKKLKKIQFDQLQNQIEIKNQVIYIPEMQVLSDAVDINLSGKHDFSNRIDYSLNFRLREIMKQVKETEFGIIEDDGLGSRIFLKMTGTASNPIFTLDKAAKKEYKKESWTEEKKNVQTLIKQEFSGLFGGDKKSETKQKAKKYTIEWEDGGDSSLTNPKLDSSAGNKKGKTLIFQTEDDIRDSDDDDY